MKAKTSDRPAAIIRRAHAINLSVAQIARDLELDAQKLYVNARLPAETLQRIEAYVAAREQGNTRATHVKHSAAFARVRNAILALEEDRDRRGSPGCSVT